MAFDDMVNMPAEWLNGEGEESEILLSSRVRLARNLKNSFHLRFRQEYRNPYRLQHSHRNTNHLREDWVTK